MCTCEFPELHMQTVTKRFHSLFFAILALLARLLSERVNLSLGMAASMVSHQVVDNNAHIATYLRAAHACQRRCSLQ